MKPKTDTGKLKIFFIRHAQSGDHEGSKRQGPDSPLGKNGKRQAKAVAKRISKEEIDVILSSKWARARETAETIAKKLKKDLELVEGIHEREENPDLYGLDMKDEFQVRYVNEVHKFGADLDWKFEGDGESLRDLIKRVAKFKKYLVKTYKDKNILVVTHGLVIRTFVVLALLGENYDDENFHKILRGLSSENTGISLLEYDQKKKKWELRYLNEHTHLRGI